MGEFSGKETIDAAGHVVAAGFIDTHFHVVDGLSVKMTARDWVTTATDLEIESIKVDAWYAAKKEAWSLSVALLSAGPVNRAFGAKGMDLVTKLTGMILLAIAMGMLAAGVKGLLPGLA